MKTVKDLHPEAMDLAEEAFRLKQKAKHTAAQKLFVKALTLEREAALLLRPDEKSEPSRSILFRSAASLAFNAGDFDEAERLIGFGLSGYPPSEIKEELKNLYEDINFQRHLHAQGIVLSQNQWQMSIYGNATSYGGTMVEPLFSRVEKVTSLFYRTVERLLGVEYRVTGSSKKEIKESFGLYINAFAPASFAVSFQVGAPDPQIKLWEDYKPKKKFTPDNVVDELLDCLELWENGKSEKLRRLIRNEVYYENFVGIAKQIAPDGEDVKAVYFRSVRDGKDRPVTLRKSRERIRQAPLVTTESRTPNILTTTFEGTLKYASTPLTKDYGTVHLQALEGMHSIRVPIGKMQEVVRPFYEETVIVEALKRGDFYYLEDIDRA